MGHLCTYTYTFPSFQGHYGRFSPTNQRLLFSHFHSHFPIYSFPMPPIVSFPPLKNLQLLFLHLCTQLFPAFHPFLAFFHCKIRSLGEKNGRELHINLHFFQRKFAILICLIYCEKSQTNPVFRTLYKNTTFHQFSLYFLVIFLSFLLRLIP